jgi:flavin reductase (DIM6/NTAB) family NADH-FMN oxidoreductase RutF
MDRGDETVNVTRIPTTPPQLGEHQLSAEGIRYAFRHHPTGVAVVTADAGNGPVPITVSSVASIEVDPPTLAFSASARSSASPTIRRAETLVVHLLVSDDVELAQLVARSGVDRSGNDVDWGGLPTGEPCYRVAHSWSRGRVVDRIDAHGSKIAVAEAVDARPPSEQVRPEPRPLVYHDCKWSSLGSDR